MGMQNLSQKLMGDAPKNAKSLADISDWGRDGSPVS